MSSETMALEIDGLGKCFHVYDKPGDRLRQFVLPRLSRMVGRPARDYYREFWALHHLDLRVRKGETIGIIGRNGSGKSTLLQMVCGTLEPTRGEVRTHGRIAALLELGAGFNPEFSGRDNVYMNAALLGLSDAQIAERFDSIAAFADIGEFMEQPVKTYSSGMYVRLAFAVAAHLEPEILIVDEVLAVGDASFQQKCLGKMEEVSRSGRTVLIVSHNMTVIEGLCERAILLEKGRVAKIGNTHEVVEGYADAIRNLAGTEIHARQDREGLGEILLTRIEVLDGDRHPVAAAITGRDIIIRMSYRCAKGKEFRNCRVSISVNGRKAQDLFVLSTDIVDPKPLTLRGEGYVDFIIPELPLTGGAYFFQSYIESNGHAQDWIKNVAPFSVLDADYYGTGKLCPPGWEANGVLIHYRWESGEGLSADAWPSRARAS